MGSVRCAVLSAAVACGVIVGCSNEPSSDPATIEDDDPYPIVEFAPGTPMSATASGATIELRPGATAEVPLPITNLGPEPFVAVVNASFSAYDTGILLTDNPHLETVTIEPGATVEIPVAFTAREFRGAEHPARLSIEVKVEGRYHSLVTAGYGVRVLDEEEPTGPTAREDWVLARPGETVEIDVLVNDVATDRAIDPASVRLIGETDIAWHEPVATARIEDGRLVVDVVEGALVNAWEGLTYEVCDVAGTCSYGGVTFQVVHG